MYTEYLINGTGHLMMTRRTGMKDMIRLVAVDMDGTLLKTDKSIHPDTVRDIKEAERHGVIAAFCTGRAVPELKGFLDTLSMIRYGVCLAGALIYDFYEKRALHKRVLGSLCVQSILRAAEKEDAMVHFLTETDSFVRADQINRLSEYNMASYQRLYQETALPVSDLNSEMQKRRDVLKANVHFHSTEDRQECLDALSALPLSFICSEASTLEITAKGVSKASGLSMLGLCLGIPLKSVMAIGDGNNDLSMLRSVGTAIAMGNAGPELKAVCDYVTDDNDNNGVGKAIRRFCCPGSPSMSE